MYRSAEAVRLAADLPVVPAILEVICRTTGMRFAAVAQVTADRWIACAVRDEMGFGLKAGGELDIETTICREVREALQPVVISDVIADPAFREHPTPSLYGFRSYISMPITLPDGQVFGTLCAIDPDPRELSSAWLLKMFTLFADMIAFNLDAHLRLAASAADLADSQRDLAVSRRDLATSASRLTASRSDLASSRANLAASEANLAASQLEAAGSAAVLLDERATSGLREQFIAVLGHDLRNPLASIDAGAKLLAREQLSERGTTVLSLLERSVGRMAALIDDVLDFARGRLGGGISIDASVRTPLAPMLNQVIDELRSQHPDRVIDADIREITDCRCDAGRIGQLLSNLLANALTHGAVDKPIRVTGYDREGVIELAVSNGGDPIGAAAMGGLFQPFVRAANRPSRQGLGLGLYIAAEIAKAHGGHITVRSDAELTTFTFTMPNT